MTHEEVRSLLERYGLSNVAERIMRVARKCVRFDVEPAESSTPDLGSCKIGGEADLPIGADWPVHNGRPLQFLAQIALLEISRLDASLGLPSSGLLSYFYDVAEQPWGFDPKHAGSSRVIFTPDVTSLERRENPDEISEEKFSECYLTPREHLSLPNWNQEDAHSLQLSDEEMEAYERVLGELNREYSAVRHQLLGWPDEIQNPMELECQLVTNGLYCGDASGYDDRRAEQLALGAPDWRLLLQLDSDDLAEMMWGDVGRLYFWIRKHDLANRSFDGVWAILQCY